VSQPADFASEGVLSALINTTPPPELLDPADPDWEAFQAGDPEYLLRVTGTTLRTYCGWHLYPSLTETLDKLPIGTAGRIMLPSLYVTDVASVAIQFNPQQEFAVQDPDTYTWFQQGYILPIGQAFWGSQWYSGFYYEPGPDFMPVANAGLASVTFTHGYDTLPDDIKQVAYELTAWSGLIKTGGEVKEVASPGFRLMLSGNPGMNLNTEQKNRLAPYRIPGVI
jgi:hypothetical protein